MANDREFRAWHDAEIEAIRAYDAALGAAHRAFREAEREEAARHGTDLDAGYAAYRRVMDPAVAAFDESRRRNPYPA